MANKASMILLLLVSSCSSSPSPFLVFQRPSSHSSPLFPRSGRNSKEMFLIPSSTAAPESRLDSLQHTVEEQERNVGQMLRDLEEKLASVQLLEAGISSKPLVAQDGEEVDPMANDLAEEMMMEALDITEQKDRELRAKEGGSFDLEHSFSLSDDEVRENRPQQYQQKPRQQYDQRPRQQIAGQQYYGQDQYQGRNQQLQNQGQQLPGQQFTGRDQYQGQNQARQQQYQDFPGSDKVPQYSQGRPRQIDEQSSQRSGLLNNFGQVMGADVSTDPEGNAFPTSPQLSPSRQALEDGGLEVEDVEEDEEEEEVRCINKVMQVEVTVYEDKIKCQHTFTEKCHDTFITDYIPTQERKCETSFDKNCHITYMPMMFEESVKLCNEPLQKVCNNDTVGQGEEVCKTHYETNCETRFKEHEVEQDEPVCTMVTERKCKDVRVPVPDTPANSGDLEDAEFRRFRRSPQGEPELTGGLGLSPDLGGNSLQNLESDGDLLSIGEECEDWPVQKCTLEKKTVKKVNPETSCRKLPREICAPSNCVFKTSEKVCRDEKRQLVQNIPTEQCELEPREDCKMETVLVPRLVQQPNCIKVPKEVCVNAKSNPKKVKKPVVKEWCYKPSDLKSPSTRLALSQFFSN